MFFTAMLIKVGLPKDMPPLGIEDSVHVHAALLTRLSKQNPSLGDHLHAPRRFKEITLAVMESTHRTATIRLTFIGVEGLSCAQEIIESLSSDPILSVGQHALDVVSMTLGDSPWTGVSTWADLAVPTCAFFLDFTFATPTAIMKKDGSGQRFSALYPEPRDVFAGLVRRWQHLEGPPLPNGLPAFLNSTFCIICSYRLNTVRFKTRRRIQIGFTGQVTYECRHHDRECVTALNALTRLAFFTGVGYQTTRGMGATRTNLI